MTTLLEHADGQILRNKLTTPPGDNAYETLEQVLQSVPAHPEALRKLRLIVERYKAWAGESIENGQWEKAATLLARAGRIAGEGSRNRRTHGGGYLGSEHGPHLEVASQKGTAVCGKITCELGTRNGARFRRVVLHGL